LNIVKVNLIFILFCTGYGSLNLISAF